MKLRKQEVLEAVIIIGLFLIAFGIRAIPSDKFQNIYGFDSYWSARMTKYIITGEKPGWPFVPMNDTVTDYPWGRIDFPALEVGYWSINALGYWLAGGGSSFDYHLFGVVASWLNAFLASLAIPFIYLFGRKAFGRITGFASALFLAFSPGHLFYSVYGHAENDGFGLSLFFLALFSFVLMVKEKKKKYGLFSLFIFSWLSLVWQSYNVAVLLISGTVIAYFIYAALLSKFGYYKNSESKAEKRKWMINSLAWVTPSVIINYLFTGKEGFGTMALPVLLVGMGIALIIEAFCFKKKPLKDYKKISLFLAAFAVIGVWFYGAALVKAPLGFFLQFGNEGKLLPYEQRMLQTIAEQNPVPGNNFFERISTLEGNFGFNIWLAFIGGLIALTKLFVVPFLRKDFDHEWDIMAFGLTFFSLWFLTQKSITLFFLSGSIAFGAGYFFGSVKKIIDYFIRKPEWKNYNACLSIIVIGFMTASSFSYFTVITENAKSMSYDVYPEWFELFDWINKNVPKGSVMTAWWDYGHWLNYFNGDKIYTSLDNIQDRKDIIYTVAAAFTHTPKCGIDQTTGTYYCNSTEQALEEAERESLSLLKPLGTNYIIVDYEIIAGTTGGKFGALEHIANNQIGCVMSFDCKKTENYYLCPIGRINTGEQAGFALTPEQWELLKNTSWPGLVVTIPVYGFNSNQKVGEVKTRWFAKDTSSGKHLLFGSGTACGNYFFQGGANPSSPVIYSFIHRLYFNDPSLKHVEKVFDNGWIVVYKVNWEGIPDPEEFTYWTKTNSVLCTGEASERCKLGKLIK